MAFKSCFSVSKHICNSKYLSSVQTESFKDAKTTSQNTSDSNLKPNYAHRFPQK